MFRWNTFHRHGPPFTCVGHILDAGSGFIRNRLDIFCNSSAVIFLHPARPKRFIEREVAHFNTAQSDDLVAERGKHPLDLMISPLMEHHLGQRSFIVL